MAQFRKKPVVVEAYLFENKVGQDTRPVWLMAAVEDGTVWFEPRNLGRPLLRIRTLEGTMSAELGDWIIKGVKGEIYPCKPDIFAETYDPA